MRYLVFLFYSILFASVVTATAQISTSNKYPSPSIITDTCQLPIFQETINLNATYAVTYDLKVTPDKGYILSGTYYTSGSGSIGRGFVIKLNQFGAIEWQKTLLFNTPMNSFRIFPRQIIVTADSGCAVFINYDGGYLGNGSMLTRFDPNGNLMWCKKLDFHNAESGIRDGIVTSDNGFAFVATGSSRFHLSKLDASGNVTWSKNFPRPLIPGGLMHASSITELNNMLYIVGLGYGINGLNVINTLIKVDKNTGQLSWCKSIGSTSNSTELRFNTITAANNKLIVSGIFDLGVNTQKQGIFQFSETGGFEKAIKIQNNHIPSNANHTTAFPLSEDGLYGANSLLYYNPNTNGINDTAAYIFKLNNAGQLKWKLRYKWAGRQSIGAIKNTVDGGFIAIGPGPEGGGVNNSGIRIIKADTLGLTNGCDLQDADFAVTNILLDTASHIIPVGDFLIDAVTDTFLYTVNSAFTRDLLCSANMECANISITGEDTVCKKGINYIYQIVKDTACHQPVVWQVSNNNIAQIISQTDTTVTVKYLTAGTVRLSAKFQFQCSSISDSLSIHVFNTPDTLNLGPDLNLCINGFYELNAHLGYRSYLWQDGSTDSTYTILTPGNYNVTVVDSCGNISSDTVVAIAAPAEILEIGNDSIICRKDTVTLSATPGFILYNWSPNYNITSTTGNSTRVFPYVDTFYKLKATKRPGCTLIDSIKISVYPTPFIQLGNDTSICAGTSLTLNAGTGFQSYLWNNGAVSQQITVSQKNIYSVIATDINGCRSTDTFEIINILPNPVVQLSKDTMICQDKTILLDAGSGYTSYLWQDGSINSTYTVSTTGFFWVIVKDNFGCIGISDTTNIRVIEPKPFNFIVHDTTICKYQTLTLIPTASFVDYIWSTGENTDKITINTEGFYWLMVTNNKGCQVTEYIDVKAKNCFSEIYFPNSFTPNNDGLNDTFKPTVYGVLEKYQLYIYNRYGKLVFYTNSWLNGWDGKYSGKLQNTGAFSWVANYTFKGKIVEIQTGSILLLK